MKQIDENLRAYFAGEITHAEFRARQCAAWDRIKAAGTRAERAALRTIRRRLAEAS